MKTGVLFANFGGPTKDEDLEPFLFELLSDVLPGPAALARFAARWLAPRRAARVRDVYRQIGWSPIVKDSAEQATAVMEQVEGDLPWAIGMMFTPPFIHHAVQDLYGQGVRRILVVGLYPHYSFATSAASYEMAHKARLDLNLDDLELHFARAFFDDARYLASVGHTIREAADELPGEGPIDLLFSAHGVPLSFVRRGDPYPEQIRTSVRRIVEELGWQDPWRLSWQSRLGPVKWLAPSTPEVLTQLGAAGRKRLILVPVSFVNEHIETLDEIDREYTELAHKAGFVHVGRATALGLEPEFIGCLADLVRESVDRFGRYSCVRCLIPKPDHHRRRKRCDNCSFQFPAYLRDAPRP